VARIGRCAREGAIRPSSGAPSITTSTSRGPQKGLEKTKASSDKYYTSNFSRESSSSGRSSGGPKQCVDELRAYFRPRRPPGVAFSASWDQVGQFKRFLGEVAAALGG